MMVTYQRIAWTLVLGWTGGLAASATQWIGVDAAGDLVTADARPARVEVRKYDAHSLEVTALLRGVELRSEGEYFVIDLCGTSEGGDVGTAMPVVRRLICGPVGAEVTWACNSGAPVSIDLHAHRCDAALSPVQASQIANVPADPAFALPDDGFARVRLVPAGVYRGLQLWLLEIQPVAYDAVHHQLVLWPRLELELNFIGGETSPTLVTAPGLRSVVLNPPPSAPPRARNYLIIAAQDFAGSEVLANFAAAKSAAGFNVIIYVPVPGSTREALKAYIQSLWGTASAPDYVVIIGDAIGYSGIVGTNHIPVAFGLGSKHACSDVQYVCMDGPTDWMPDIAVGRFPVRTIPELEAELAKTLLVESGAYDPSYTERAVFIAGTDYYSGGEGLQDQIISTFIEPDNIACTRLYESLGSTTQDISDAFNNGCFLGAYYGHAGGSQSWYSPPYHLEDLWALTNTDLYPFLISFSCSTSAFHYTDPSQSPGWLESWMLAPEKGAAATYGCSTNQNPYTWSHWATLYRYMFQALYAERVREIGYAAITAAQHFVEYYGPEDPASVDHTEAFFILGDPSLVLPDPPPQNYLMVVPQDWADSAPVVQLLAHRADRGYNATRYVVPAGTSREAIKAHLLGLWGTPDAPDYIALVGDTAGSISTGTTIPHWVGGGDKQAATDLPYACMDPGDDWYPDIAIGRFPAASLTQLQAMVDKTIKVESGSFSNPNYTKRVALAVNADTNGVGEPTADWIINNYLAPNEYQGIRIFASQGGNTTHVRNAVNTGCLLLTYMGHSGTTGWWSPSFTQTDVRALLNAGLYPVVLGWSCSTAHYELAEECFGETWVRAGQKGAAAYISASNYIYWGSPEAWEPSSVLQKSFFASLFEDGIWELGPAWQNALYRFLSEYGQPDVPGGPPTQHADVVRNFFEEFVLFGDPALSLPPDSGFRLELAPDVQSLCQPENFDALFMVTIDRVGTFNEPVSLSVTGTPAGAVAEFSLDNLPPPFTAVLTLRGLSNAVPGPYNLVVTATSASKQRSSTVRLNLSSAVPGATTLVSPADGAVNVAKQPALVWGAATQATTYHVDISQTSNFSQIVYSADVSEETTLAVDIYLESLSTYYWRVRGVNACGNGAWSPTFRFTTVSQLDYFTEEFTGTSDPVDLDYLTLRLTPDGSADFYSACLEVAASLPTDPAGGTYVALGDDGSAAVSVPQPVQLYGVPYSTLYINANANITFGQSDGTWEESLNSHFGLPRIAALFDDLNPLSNTTSYKILVNRVVVTGVDVPELYDGGANTYQVELYYDGTIQITWLGLTCSDAIIGLSAGDGLPPDFLESQLAGMPVCPPPSACCTGEACTLLTEYDCAAAGGVFAGPDVACTPNPCVSYDSSCLIISEVVQGGESGNCPRWVELTNTGGTDFAFIEGGLIVQTGTSTDVNVDVDLSGVVIPAGQAYVINSNFSGACTGAFPAIYGFEPHQYSNTEFCFGDERLILTDTSDGSHLIDIYGEFGVDGTGQPWEFTTGYAYRRPEWTYGAGPQFHLSEWVVGGVGSLLGDNPTEMLLTLTTPGLHAVKQACTLNYRGDLNCDGAVDFGDINAFVLALTNPDTYAAQFPGCPLANRDVDRNGVFDFADINPFIQVLSSLR